ncbi:hypothetical protein ACFS7Z_26160 [Pontibacter toksunensis]|uniref:Uncharacterized protein n=1 Tax=Pontibacter toksunensis TaxID=1332631 RepID=A0ABW6C3Z9_9BACT
MNIKRFYLLISLLLLFVILSNTLRHFEASDPDIPNNTVEQAVWNTFLTLTTVE